MSQATFAKRKSAPTAMAQAPASSLRIGEPNDAFEQEADRVANEIMAGGPLRRWSIANVGVNPPLQRKCSCGGSGGECEECKKQEGQMLRRKPVGHSDSGFAPSIVHEVLTSPGQSLDKRTREFFEPQFGFDLGSVRIHSDSQAAESATAVNAQAYATGSHLVFGEGCYQPSTAAGKQLLGHELAHVVQQRGHNAVVQRQTKTNTAITTQAQSPSPTPGFSVNQAEYMKLVDQALQRMQGRAVEAHTLAPTIRPVLQSLLGHETWVDRTGKQQGGSAVRQQFPGMSPSSVSIKLVLDDSSGGVKLGDFTPSGTVGTIRIFVQKNTDAETLAETLFHESLHMMNWLANRPTPPTFAQGTSPQVRALTRARNAPEVRLVRNVLDNLGANINAKRQSHQQTPITPAGLDHAASFLVEEVMVRAETAVFSKLSASVVIGPITTTTPGGRTLSSEIDSKTIDQYLFDFSGDFKPGDRSLLDAIDKQYLDAITEILINFANHQIQRRTASPGAQISVPREQVSVPLPPLNP